MSIESRATLEHEYAALTWYDTLTTSQAHRLTYVKYSLSVYYMVRKP